MDGTFYKILNEDFQHYHRRYQWHSKAYTVVHGGIWRKTMPRHAQSLCWQLYISMMDAISNS